MAERLTTSENAQSPSSWSPDGQALAFFESPSGQALQGGNRDIWVLPMEGEREPEPYIQTPFDEGGAVFSPDGRRLAYASDESGRVEVYVQPFPTPGAKWQISAEGGMEPVWSRDGRELFYRNGDRMMAVDITTEPSFSAGTPKMLFEVDFEEYGGVGRAEFDVTPDGQRFLMIKAVEPEQPVTKINVVLNWFEELQQRVPVQ